MSEKSRSYYEKNSEIIKARAMQWRKDNPDKAKAIARKAHVKKYAENREVLKADRDLNKNKYKNRALKSAFGIDLNEYNKMLNEQNGVCAICGQTETKISKGNLVSLAVDHDHATGKIRGLLCFNCNLAMGKFHDNVEMMKKAIEYILKNR